MIEEYWDDIVIYSVGFVAKGKPNNKDRTFYKTLAFNHSMSEKEVVSLMHSKLKNIIKVIYVDEITDAILLKK